MADSTVFEVIPTMFALLLFRSTFEARKTTHTVQVKARRSIEWNLKLKNPRPQKKSSFFQK